MNQNVPSHPTANLSQADTALPIESGNAHLPLPPRNAIDNTAAGTIRSVLLPLLSGSEHLSTLIYREPFSIVTIETPDSHLSCTSRAIEIQEQLSKALECEDGIVANPTVRVISVPSVGALEHLGHLRALYLEFPEITGIDVREQIVTTASTATYPNSIDRRSRIENFLLERYKIPFTIQNREDTPSTSVIPDARLHQALALPLSLFRNTLNVFTPPISSLTYDFSARALAIETERAMLSPQTKERISKEILAHEPEMVLTLSEDPHMQGLTRFLSEFAPSKIEAFRIQRQSSFHTVRVLLNTEDASEVSALVRTLNSQLTKAMSSACRVESVVNSSALAKRCFLELPYDWGFTNVATSPNGRCARVFSTKPTSPALSQEIVNDFSAQYPDGICINDESLLVVQKDTPLRTSVIRSIPTRYAPSEVYECKITGELKVRVALEIPKEEVAGIARILGRDLSVSVAPTCFPSEPIRPALRFMNMYAERLPFFPARNDNAVTFHGIGACGLIGGSCHALNMRGIKVLLDCGAWLDESKKLALPPSFISDTDFMVLSHLHTDHVGGLLEAVMSGFAKPILTTRPTAIAMISILQEQAMRKGIPGGWIEEVYKLIRIVPIGEKIPVSDNLTVAFYPAGHVVGSATVRFEHTDETDKEYSVLYTGDYKFAPSRLHLPAVIPPPSDVVISEGTYGAREMPARHGVEEALIAELHRTLEAKGTALLPVLNFNRAQEVLSLLYENMGSIKERGADIFLVGGVIQRNQQYDYLSKTHPEEFSEAALRARPWQECTHTAISRPNRGNEYHPYLLRSGTPQVIIASGGMVVGHSEALVRHHCTNPNNSLLLTCYQAADTLGRQILDFSEGRAPAIEGIEYFPMRVNRYQLSGHSAVRETSSFLTQALKPGGRVVLVHGENEELTALSDHLITNGITTRVLQPQLDTLYDLMGNG